MTNYSCSNCLYDVKGDFCEFSQECDYGESHSYVKPSHWEKKEDAAAEILDSGMSRKNILETAISTVCVDREKQYGSPENNFRQIAEFWSNYLQWKIDSHDVAVMMALLKIARISSGQKKADNYIDLAGYAACAAELRGADNGHE